MAVTVTENAAREVAAIAKQQELNPEKLHLRVGVKGGGCSGFSYLLDLTENLRDTDEIWEFSYNFNGAKNGDGDGEDAPEAAAVATDEPFVLRVVCDPKSYLYLNGTTIDFKDELMGRGFVFSNPNASSTCGCGSSFAV